MPSLNLYGIPVGKVDTVSTNDTLYERTAFQKYIDKAEHDSDNVVYINNSYSEGSNEIRISLESVIGHVHNIYINDDNVVYVDLVVYNEPYCLLLYDAIKEGTKKLSWNVSCSFDVKDGIKVIHHIDSINSFFLTDNHALL